VYVFWAAGFQQLTIDVHTQGVSRIASSSYVIKLEHKDGVRYNICLEREAEHTTRGMVIEARSPTNGTLAVQRGAALVRRCHTD